MTYQYPNTVIQIFCKAPIPGQVKTRLIPDLTAIQAAQIHQLLTLQTLKLVTSSNLCTIQLWCSPTISHLFFQQMENKFSLTLLPQSTGDLGNRMFEALSHGNKTFKNVLLIGCDCPSLSKEDLAQGIQALQSGYDTVLAPAEDGGYCLIGSNSPQIELFSEIAWGGNKVLFQTREKVRTLALNCLELKTQWDVDNYDDYLRYVKYSQNSSAQLILKD